MNGHIEVIVEKLIEAFGDSSRVLTEVQDLYSYSFDASFGIYKPEIICQPIATDEVVELIKLAAQYKIPVVARGTGTSLSGGPLPVKGGIVVDFSLWDTKLEIHPDDLIAVVSPGVITSKINDKAIEFGLMYPPDPSSAHVSTIGGNLAENAGGPRGLKYGVTKDYVLGLEVVTAEGKVIRTGGRTMKNVTGYDLTKLIVGSEGTLCIITEATLRLVPRPLATKTAMVLFDEIVDSGHAISKVLRSGIMPAKMEIMDRHSIIAVEEYASLGLPIDVEAILLIELDGHHQAINEEMIRVEEACMSVNARSVIVAKDDREAEQLWQARRLVSPAIVKIKPTKISEDATVPRSKIPEMFQRLKEIREKYNVHLVVFGHAGDGNLHPNIIADQRDEEEMHRVEQAVEEIFEAAVSLGGTLSGEHGIGLMKSPFMEMELGKDGLHMMKLIKDAWDPQNILNPGKIFPEPGQRFVLRND
ncbi:FAD-binding oxidoreductase [Sporosarcina jiandibaonis]|uniref:FAD-binding oxidoreductase n=1 Tax=Sporosarcina jiandibaonis TaxID=2715535 RepID=UPI001554374F|nr:FAD-linked oxidase C-terminal domain-containing protein [Sporosarcina jiandibaonis]